MVYEMTTSGFNAPSVQSFYAKYDYVVVLRIAALQDARKQAKIIRLADNMRNYDLPYSLRDAIKAATTDGLYSDVRNEKTRSLKDKMLGRLLRPAYICSDFVRAALAAGEVWYEDPHRVISPTQLVDALMVPVVGILSKHPERHPFDSSWSLADFDKSN